MKPTSMLNKLSVAGMLASCIFLVHCGPKKHDDSADKMAEKLALENALPACNEETMKLLKERNSLFESIRAILSSPLDDAQKVKLQTQIDEIYPKSQAIGTKVRSSKVAGFPATGCVFKTKVSENDTLKDSEIKYDLAVIKTEDLALAKRVKVATEKPNLIDQNARPQWKAGDKLKVSAELAQMISDVNALNGNRTIYSGKIVGGGQDYKFLKNRLTESYCIVVTFDGQLVAANETAEIANITSRLDNKARITQDIALLIPSLSGKRSLLLSCTLADGSDLNDAMVDTFSSLLTKLEVVP